MLLEALEKITGIFVVVYDGQHALKFTLGRAGNIVGPGVHFKWPIVQAYRVRDTKDTTIELEPQTIQLKDDLVYEVGARSVYQIVDLRKAMIYGSVVASFCCEGFGLLRTARITRGQIDRRVRESERLTTFVLPPAVGSSCPSSVWQYATKSPKVSIRPLFGCTRRHMAAT